MKPYELTDFAAFVGIDWADKKHDICIQIPGTTECLHAVLAHRPEAIKQWAVSLLKQFGGKPIAVCCELRKGPLVYALEKYPHLVLFPVNPQAVAKLRKAFATSGAKDDPTDAELQCDILQKHFKHLKPLTPQTPGIRTLQQLVEYRRRAVADKVRITNRMTSALKNYYPQVLQWFPDKDTVIFCDFLERWPSLEQAQKARRDLLLRFFQSHNARYDSRNQQRIVDIKVSQALTDDPGVIVPNQLAVVTLVAQLRATLHAIKLFDKHMAKLFRNQPDRDLFEKLPGAGPVFAPRLLAAFGDDRSRYPHAEDLQRYGGIAPVLERSGNKSWVHWRYCCPRFLQQTFVEWAGETVKLSFWANAFYEQQKAKGKTHQTIIRALAYKWIRILHRCWLDRKPYDEAKYLLVLKKKQSPLLQFATARLP